LYTATALLYPVLKYLSPGIVALVVRYQKTRIEIELTRERNNQPLIFGYRRISETKSSGLKTIGGTISYKGRQWNH
jgi:hypothetical protein